MIHHPHNDALSEIAAHGSSARLGTFFDMRELRVAPDFDFLFASTVEVRNVGQSKVVTAAGGAFTRTRARTSAIGEAIERLGLCTYRSDLVEWSAFDDLRGRALDPRRCLHYPDEVYQRAELGIARFAPGDVGAWMPATTLGSGEAIHVPAVFAFNQLPPDFPPRVRWDRPLSTGAACAFDRAQAVLTGLYEVIERDALMLHWENRLPGRQRSSDSAACAAIRAKGFDLHLVELSTDLGARVALAAVADRTGRRAALGVGTAARATWEEAAHRAIEEAILCMMWVSDRRAWSPIDLAAIDAELAGIPDPVLHAEYYAHARNRPHCAFLWERAGPPAAPAEDRPVLGDHATPGAELAALQACLAGLGHEVIVVDITPAEALTFGLSVVRVIVPGLVPLGRGIHARQTLNPRLRQAAPAGRFVGNPAPHPLP